jgi:hypothetical protein
MVLQKKKKLVGLLQLTPTCKAAKAPSLQKKSKEDRNAEEKPRTPQLSVSSAVPLCSEVFEDISEYLPCRFSPTPERCRASLLIYSVYFVVFFKY